MDLKTYGTQVTGTLTLKSHLEYLLIMSRRLSLEQASEILLKYDLKVIGNYQSVSKKVLVLCLKCQSESEVVIDSIRKRQNSGCENCARKKQASLSELEAIKSMREKGLEPIGPWEGYKAPWLCKCTVCKQEVHVARESIRRRSSEFKGCIECAKKSQSEKMVSANREKVLDRFKAKNLLLKSDYVNSRLLIEVECMTCGHIFSTQGIRIGRQKYGCAKCSGNYVDPKEAKDFMKLSGYEPLVPFSGAHQSWESTHLLCGNVVTPSYSTLKSGNGGCKYCAEYGFQYSKPAYLYLITNEALGAHKIGIANPAKIKKSDRLHRYRHNGWSVIKVWDFPNGKVAEEIENELLLYLRVNLGLPPYLTISDMGGHKGHTETVSAEAISLLELERMIVKAAKGLQE